MIETLLQNRTVQVLIESFPRILLPGLAVTIPLTVLSFAFAMVIAAAVALAHISHADIARLRRKTAFVFQSYNLFRNKTVLQNVTEGLIVARKMHKAQAEEIAVQMLEKVGMADRCGQYPHQLSGGQQQRVAIARALATSPEIIYFDEPTSALDPELTGEVLDVMRQLAAEGMTMLVVTHEMGFARDVSSHVIFMEDGHIIESAPSAEFFANPRQERTRVFLSRIANR